MRAILEKEGVRHPRVVVGTERSESRAEAEPCASRIFVRSNFEPVRDSVEHSLTVPHTSPLYGPSIRPAEHPARLTYLT